MSNVFLISFEIGFGASFQERSDYNRIYSACEAAIKLNIGAADYWSENTAFYVIRTEEDASKLLDRIWLASGMRRDRDRLVILDANKATGQAFGAIRDGALFSLLPRVTAPELHEAWV